MYGHLSIDNDGFLLVTLPTWDLRQPVTITEAGRLKRATLMTRMGSLPAGEERNRLYIGISSALPFVPDDFVLYAIDIGMTYFRLPAAELEKRNREIQSLVDAEFDAVDVKAHAGIGGMVKCLKAIGYLRSGSELDLFVQHWCTTVRKDLSDPRLGVLEPLKAAMQVIARIAVRLNTPETQASLKGVATSAMTSACPIEVKALQQALQQVMANARGESVIVQLDRAFAASSLPPPNRSAALRDAVAKAAADPELTGTAAAQQALARANERMNAEHAVLIRVSVEAIEAGQTVGEFTGASRQALEQLKAARLACEENALQTLLRLGQREREHQAEQARQRSAAPSIALSAGPEVGDGAAERDTLQRLSLSQLLRWIDGPVTGPRRRPLDRRAALTKARAQRVPPVQQVIQPPPGQNAPRRDEPVDPEPSAHDIAAVAAHGYAATAAFLRDEIRDMLPVAEQLKLAIDVITQATTLADSLDRLCAALEIALDGFDEEATQLELSSADAALTALREQLAQQKQSVQRQAQFMGALVTALAREELRLDRRDGGVVPCPLQPMDWGWVAEQCHRRWLSGVQRLMVDGKLTDLGNDEALALHVTGSSRSREAYVFNVSVHLWRRDHGNTSLPSAAHGPWPPMNTDAWFDTYRTCCVLHVPRS